MRARANMAAHVAANMNHGQEIEVLGYVDAAGLNAILRESF